jgi:hypothetical protein
MGPERRHPGRRDALPSEAASIRGREGLVDEEHEGRVGQRANDARRRNRTKKPFAYFAILSYIIE